MFSFRRSIDAHILAKQAMTEELAWLQISYHYDETRRGENAYMGFPWMLRLLTNFTRLHALKARTETLSGIVHSADLKARDTITRQIRYTREYRDDEIADQLVAFERTIEWLLRTCRPPGEFTYERAMESASFSELTAGLNEIVVRAKRMQIADAVIQETEARYNKSAKDVNFKMQMRLLAMIGERPEQLRLNDPEDEYP